LGLPRTVPPPESEGRSPLFFFFFQKKLFFPPPTGRFLTPTVPPPGETFFPPPSDCDFLFLNQHSLFLSEDPQFSAGFFLSLYPPTEVFVPLRGPNLALLPFFVKPFFPPDAILYPSNFFCGPISPFFRAGTGISFFVVLLALCFFPAFGEGVFFLLF